MPHVDPMPGMRHVTHEGAGILRRGLVVTGMTGGVSSEMQTCQRNLQRWSNEMVEIQYT
jgi:hypothetical protein